MGKINNALSDDLGYNPYRDSEGRFDDGPQLLASRGRPKIESTEQRKKIDQAKERLRKQYAIEDTKPEREKVLDGPTYMEVPGFRIGEDTIPSDEVRTILWKDKELRPGQTFGQYYATEKARKGDLFMMSPAEYRESLIQSGQYKDIAGIERRMDWDKVDQYTEDMQSGDKFPLPALHYDKDGQTQQEGLHRIYAAERVGIEEVPVVVSSDTRNQKIYPYQKLENKILSQDEIHDVQKEPTREQQILEQIAEKEAELEQVTASKEEVAILEKLRDQTADKLAKAKTDKTKSRLQMRIDLINARIIEAERSEEETEVETAMDGDGSAGEGSVDSTTDTQSNTVTEEEVNSLVTWGNGSWSMSKVMRGQDIEDINNLEGVKADIENIRSAISKTTREDDTVVYRGAMLDKDLKIGDVITDKSFTATTTKRDTAEMFAGQSKRVLGDLKGNRKQAIIEFTIPAGANAIEMAKLEGYEDILGEILLSENLSIRIDSIKKNSQMNIYSASIVTGDQNG